MVCKAKVAPVPGVRAVVEYGFVMPATVGDADAGAVPRAPSRAEPDLSAKDASWAAGSEGKLKQEGPPGGPRKPPGRGEKPRIPGVDGGASVVASRHADLGREPHDVGGMGSPPGECSEELEHGVSSAAIGGVR